MENLHFYVDAIALGIAILTLIPVYMQVGRAFFFLLTTVVLLCVVAISAWIHFDHQAEIEVTKGHIRTALGDGPKTIDEITRGLPFKDVSRASEALGSLLDAPVSEIWFGDVRLENCTGGVNAEVRRYYLRSSKK